MKTRIVVNCFKQIIDRKVVYFAFFFCITFLLYGDMILNDELFVSGDGMMFFNSLDYLRECIKEGYSPFWNNMLNAGKPYINDLTNLGLYPFRWVLLWLDIKWFIYAFYALHLALGSTFFSLYIKEIELCPLIVQMSGVLYYFSIYLGGYRKGHMQIIACVVYLPIILYYVERYLHTKKLSYLLCSSFAMALQFLAGFPQIAIYTDLFVGVYLLLGLNKKNICIYIKDCIMWGLMYIGLIMIQLVPFIEMYLFYLKGGSAKTSLDIFRTYSVHPIYLIKLICPTIFSLDSNAVLPGVSSTEVPSEIFLGSLIFCFAVYAIFSNGLKGRVGKCVVGMIIIVIYASNGCFSKVANIMYLLPILNGFRCSSRIMFIFYFLFLVLALIGMNSLVEKECFKQLERIIITTICCLIIIMVTVITISNENVIEVIAQYEKTLFVLGFYLFILLILKHKDKQLIKSIICVVAVLLTILEVFPYWKASSVMTVEEYGVDDTIEEYLSSNAKNNKVLLANPYIDGGYSSPIMDNFNIPLGFSAINSYTNMNDSRLSKLLTSEEIFEPQINLSGEYTGFPDIYNNLRNDNDILSMLDIKYIIDKEDIVPNNDEIIKTNKQLQNNPYELCTEENGIKVYKNNNSHGILYIPNRVIKIKNIDELYTRPRRYYDYDRVAYVEEIDDFEVGSADIKLVNDMRSSISATVSAYGESFLIFSQAYYPGWNAYIDGQRVDVNIVNGYIQGIKIPDGKHEVLFRYMPWSLFLGAGITFIFLIAFCVIIGLEKRHR